MMNHRQTPITKFSLPKSFVSKYENIEPPFGFNGIGKFTYERTYSRLIGDRKERWFETVERVVNGTFNMQLDWFNTNHMNFDIKKSLDDAEKMYDLIFNMKFLPPGRGLWAMGTSITDERKLYASLNNCAFVSTENLLDNPTEPFTFLMDASMLGVGVGFDTKGAGKIMIKRPKDEIKSFVVPDSREGWVEGLKVLLESYFYGKKRVEFDCSKLRKKDELIKGFGGKSSGPAALVQLKSNIEKVLDKNIDIPITITSIVDIMNYIGVCVVAGNIRRTAEIAFGDPTNDEYINLKNYDLNPDRMAHGWTSNNSVFCDVGMDYSKISIPMSKNGEPGCFWLDNARKFDRMNNVVTNTDHKACGGNPCLEQTLESFELCCLVETFPAKHKDLQDYLNTLKYAFMYAKTVTLGRTHWKKTNDVMSRNRRVGTSMSGIAQFIAKFNIEELRIWCNNGYSFLKEFDKEISEYFSIRESIKITSIKPSGTVSLLAGATPGIHYPISRHYIRRIRVAKSSEFVENYRKLGYHIEPAFGDEDNTMVVSFPVDVGENVRSLKDVSVWEQICLASFMQEHWADNQVSFTATFKENEKNELCNILNYFQYKLKGISFLPEINSGYAQMPYEQITEDQYNEMMSLINNKEEPSLLVNVHEDPVAEQFCDGDHCTF